MRLLLAILFLCCSALSAQPDKDEKQEQATAQGQKAASDDFVIVVQDDAETKTAAHADADHSQSPEWKTADQTERLADYTKLLWIFTLLIAVIAIGQFCMFWLQLKAMRATLILANRPRIVLRAMTMIVGDHPELGKGHAITDIKFLIANTGSSAARLKGSSIRADLIRNNVPVIPVYDGGEIECKAKRFGPGDTEQVVSKLEVAQARPAIVDPVYGFNFIVSGYVVYFDDIGTRYQSYFYRYWDAKAERFTKSQDPDLEYEY